MASKMAEPRDVRQGRQHIMQKVPRNSRAFPFKKYRCPESTAHSHSPDAKLRELTLAPTILVLLSGCVLKSPVWRTEFVTTHTHGVIAPKIISRELSEKKFFD